MLAADVIESAERRVGATVGGKWHLDRVIGVGGMAAVYEATHRNRNRVAIKLLHPALSLDEGTRRRFQREGYVANTIRHSGAVQVLDDDVTEDGYAFLVMELLRGESVEERMIRKGGALSMHEALDVADQLLEVLEAAHDQNVVHRDIKPDNLFLTEDGKLKVLDFGIARLHQGDSRTTKVGSFMGTPAFCAQEQARGRWDEVDHRTDLYSVGASLFTCLTGVHVHEAETSSEQLALAIGATARSLREVLPGAPAELVELVDIALAYDKEDRFQSARAMRAAVRRVKAGLPMTSKVSTPAPPAPRRAFGHSEIDPESMPPAGLPSGASPLRLLLGIVAAVLLAVAIFYVSKPSDVKSRAAAVESSPVRQQAQVTASSSQQELKVAAGAKAAPEVANRLTPAPSQKIEQKAQVAPTKPAAAASASRSEPPSTTSATGESSASFPQPDPSPTSPSGESDEGMFEKRF